MTELCDLRKILREAQARQDEELLKVLAALKASTACWGVGRKKNDIRIKIPNMKKIFNPVLPLTAFLHLSRGSLPERHIKVCVYSARNGVILGTLRAIKRH